MMIYRLADSDWKADIMLLFCAIRQALNHSFLPCVAGRPDIAQTFPPIRNTRL